MAIVMIKPTMLNVALMEEIVVDHASIQTIAPIALALEMPLGMEYPMFLLEIVFAMMK